MWCWLWVLYTFSLTAGSLCSPRMTSWGFRLPAVASVPRGVGWGWGWCSGGGEPERRLGEQILTRSLSPSLSLLLRHIHTQSADLSATSLWAQSLLLARLWCVDGWDRCVFPPPQLGDSLSVLFSKSESSGISWAKTIIRLRGDLVRWFSCLEKPGMSI